MKARLTVFFLLISFIALGQSFFLKEAAVKLDNALVKKDTVVLKQLLHKDLSFGHSNAWVQTKSEVLNDLFNGKLNYTRIKHKETKWTVGKDWATMRSNSSVEYKLDGKTAELNLHVLQMWLKTNRGWQLLARQSTKL